MEDDASLVTSDQWTVCDRAIEEKKRARVKGTMGRVVDIEVGTYGCTHTRYLVSGKMHLHRQKIQSLDQLHCQRSMHVHPDVEVDVSSLQLFDARGDDDECGDYPKVKPKLERE